MSQVVSLPADFEPRPYQVAPMRYLDNGGKRAMCVWHRRGGKDLVFGNQTAKAAHERIGMYWHVFPSLEQGRRSLWEGFRKDGKRTMETIFPGFGDPKSAGSIVARRNEQQMMLELKCGSIWRIVGSDRVELVGAGPVGLVFSEFALCKPTSWDFLRPMVAENEGWAAFITTPRGNNHAKRLYDSLKKQPDAFTDLKTLYDTRAYDPEKTIAEDRASGMPEALIRQEYLCDWTAALVGSVWGDLLEVIEKSGGMEPFEHDRDRIFTSWDIGIDDACDIWFWRHGEGDAVEFVDHYESHGKPLSHYLDVIEEKASLLEYRYAKHFLPHDARNRTFLTGSSVREQFDERHPGMVQITPSLSLLDGIQAARWLLQRHGTRFHPRCAVGVDALKQYHYEYDAERKIYTSKPEHDWASHSADAFRYAAVVARASRALIESAPKAKQADPETFGKVTLDELFEAHDRRATKRSRI